MGVGLGMNRLKLELTLGELELATNHLHPITANYVSNHGQLGHTKNLPRKVNQLNHGHAQTSAETLNIFCTSSILTLLQIMAPSGGTDPLRDNPRKSAPRSLKRKREDEDFVALEKRVADFVGVSCRAR